MRGSSPSDASPFYDRRFLLGDAKRNDVLTLAEVRAYGRDSFGDPDYVSLYGLRPAEWYARGVRVLARTAVECTRDRLADRIGRDIAAIARPAPAVSGFVAVDLFAGSANTLHWIQRHVGAERSIGFELDDAVYESSQANLAALDLHVELIHEDYEAGLAALDVRADRLTIVFVAPPWGDALSVGRGLDLRDTTPPVAETVDAVLRTFPARRLLLATQVHETVEPVSLSELTPRFDWSTLKAYDIDRPGRNHGILLATVGWTPQTSP